MAIAAPPPPGTPAPELMESWARQAGRSIEGLVWRSELGAITARLSGNGSKDLFAKWSPVDLEPEAERMSWLSSRHPSPRVFDFVAESGEWLLVTGALPGESAAAERWKSDPAKAATAIGAGLGRLHSLDPTDSMFGEIEWVGNQREIDQLVIAHGDACVPNTLLTPDGDFLAHVDLGSLGVADRWADLAVAAWSIEQNFGVGFQEPFWASYDIAPDPDRIQHYQSLWQLGNSGAKRS